MSCVIEVYDITQYRSPARYTSVHTNLGYTHYMNAEGVSGLFKCVGFQYIRFGKGKKKARYDSWLRDGPPECVV